VLSIAVVDGGLDTRRFIAAYPTGVHVVGIVAVSQPPPAVEFRRGQHARDGLITRVLTALC
jgi:hypothetical protein